MVPMDTNMEITLSNIRHHGKMLVCKIPTNTLLPSLLHHVKKNGRENGATGKGEIKTKVDNRKN